YSYLRPQDHTCGSFRDSVPMWFCLCLDTVRGRMLARDTLSTADLKHCSPLCGTHINPAHHHLRKIIFGGSQP
ncbi:hypothetical protein PanWU01x14_236690, partial [Parasponia andersonii]